LLHPGGSGHDSDRVKHFQVTLLEPPCHTGLRPHGSVGGDCVSCVKCDCYFHISAIDYDAQAKCKSSSSRLPETK